MGVNLPVLCLLFNRPDYATKLASSLAAVQPRVLYVAVDGPRAHKPGEAALCQATADVFRDLPWKPVVHFLIREQNLGCKNAVSSAISWFFSEVQAGVILEDDCIAHPDFFRFAEGMLERYRDDERVFGISGASLAAPYVSQGSYSFSKYPHVWGWASWQRAWRHYDVKILGWPAFRDSDDFRKLFPTSANRDYWAKNLDAVYEGRVDTWDFQWAFTHWARGAVSLTPKVNLVQNIGFDKRATHTTRDEGLSLAAHAMPPPYEAPARFEIDRVLDGHLETRLYRERSLPERIREKLMGLFK